MDTVFLALRVLLSLAVVLGAIWYAHRRLTRNGRLMPRAAKTVNVVAKQSVGGKASVVVMDVDGQRFLLGVTEQSVTVLNTSETPAEQPRELTAVAPAPARVAGVSATSPNGGAAFARVLSQLQSEPVEHANPSPVAYLPEARTSPLDGSILSPNTWKRAATALRRAR